MTSNNKLTLIFSLNDCKFAIEIECLVEVAENIKISTTIDNEDCLGKIDFRGKSIYMADIKNILKMGISTGDEFSIIVARTGGILLAIPVDSVDSVEEIVGTSFPFPEMMLTKKSVLTSIYKWHEEFVYKVNIDELFKGFIPTLPGSVEN